MRVHVIPEEAAEVHAFGLCCWCRPAVDDAGMVTHRHPPGANRTRWLVVQDWTDVRTREVV